MGEGISNPRRLYTEGQMSELGSTGGRAGGRSLALLAPAPALNGCVAGAMQDLTGLQASSMS